MARAAPARTRAANQARTRQLVREAAERLFLANGYTATSLEDVAREAGFSKGAVYSNFSGKVDLFFAVVESRWDRLSAELRASITAEPDATRQLAAVGRWYERYLQEEQEWARTLPELAAVARTDDEARTRFAALLQGIERTVADLVAEQQEALGIGGIPPASVAALVVALVMGLTVRSLHDLDSPPDLLQAALPRLLL